MKKYCLLTLGLLFWSSLVPTQVHATTLDELRGQVERLQLQIRALLQRPATSGPAPIFTSLSKPLSLPLKESGHWTLRASDPAGERLTYFVSWEDGTFGYSPAVSSGQSVTLSHSYQTLGNYYPTFWAQTASGRQTSKMSLGTNVTPLALLSAPGGTALVSAGKLVYAKIISPAGGERLRPGYQVLLSWDSSSLNQVDLTLWQGSAPYQKTNVWSVSLTTNPGYYYWTVPTNLPAGQDYRLEVRDHEGVTRAISENPFSIE